MQKATGRRRPAKPGMILHQYIAPDGSFDYQSYREIQNAGNREKLDWVWVREENIAFLARYIRNAIGMPRFGICHGTRRGKEQEWFRAALHCEVIGTEIADTASQFPHTIQWDFHEAKPEWLGAADFIYSNSFDHSYDPERCIRTWMSCVRPGGLCLLEHSSLHGPGAADRLDPFGADLSLMPWLLLTWSEGRFGVRALLDLPSRDPSLDHLSVIVLQNW
jgi:hypothetical protein